MVPLAGDYNQDDAVDAADYIVWRNTLGQTGGGLAADGDSDNQVDTDDHIVWRNNFGQTNSLGGAADFLDTTVPEPDGIAVIAVPILIYAAMWRIRRRRKRQSIHPEYVGQTA